MRFHIATLSIVLTATPFLSPNALAAGITSSAGNARVCTNAFSNSLGEWRPAPGQSPYAATRANVAHLMNSLQKDLIETNSIPNLSAIKGSIGGDFHGGNIDAIENANHTRSIGLNDFDSGGQGISLIHDFARNQIANMLLGLPIDFNEAISSYQDGLLKRDRKIPKIVQDAYALSEEDYLEIQKDHIKKITTDGRLNEKSKTVPLESAPAFAQKLFAVDQNDLLEALGMDRDKILDMKFRMKIGEGGSQNIPRFVFLIKNSSMPKNMEVIEFKQQITSDSEVLAPQKNPVDRIADQRLHFQSAEPKFGRFGVIKTKAGNYYIMRTKLKAVIEFPEDLSDLSKAEIHEWKDVALYYIYSIGLFHSRMDSGRQLASSITSSPQELTALQNWISGYVKKVIQTQSKQP